MLPLATVYESRQIGAVRSVPPQQCGAVASVPTVPPDVVSTSGGRAVASCRRAPAFACTTMETSAIVKVEPVRAISSRDRAIRKLPRPGRIWQKNEPETPHKPPRSAGGPTQGATSDYGRFHHIRAPVHPSSRVTPCAGRHARRRRPPQRRCLHRGARQRRRLPPRAAPSPSPRRPRCRHPCCPARRPPRPQ